MYRAPIFMLAYILLLSFEGNSRDFPSYNNVICLDVSGDIHFTAQKGAFSVYFETNFLRYSDFAKKGLLVPDSLSSLVSRRRSDDFVLFKETTKSSYTFDGESFLIVENQRFGNKTPNVVNSLMPSNHDSIAFDELEYLIPEDMRLHDYFLTDLNGDGAMDLVLYYFLVNGFDEDLGTIEIFERKGNDFESVQMLPEIDMEFLHLSYLIFENSPPIVFVGGRTNWYGDVRTKYYFFTANENSHIEESVFWDCNSFIKQEPYQLIKD